MKIFTKFGKKMFANFFRKMSKLNLKFSQHLDNKFLYPLLGTSYGLFHYGEYCLKNVTMEMVKDKPETQLKLTRASQRLDILRELGDRRSWNEFHELTSLKDEIASLNEKQYPSDEDILEFREDFHKELRSKFFMYSDDSEVTNVMISVVLFTLVAKAAVKIPVISVPMFGIFLYGKYREDKKKF